MLTIQDDLLEEQGLKEQQFSLLLQNQKQQLGFQDIKLVTHYVLYKIT